MKIVSGLMPFQVLQRKRPSGADARITGVLCRTGAGEVFATVLNQGKALPAFSHKKVGRFKAGQWTAALKGLPTGGPYDVVFESTAKDTITIPGVLVGDVWFLAGQSNMQGMGNLCEAPAPDPLVRAFYMWDEWNVAEEPITFLPGAIDPVHGADPIQDPAVRRKARKAAVKGVGPGVVFGKEMLRITGVPQGLVCCAHGGTTMDQWSPELKGQGGASFYGALLRRFQKLGQPIVGMLWFQGGSDASNPGPYSAKMHGLVAAVRKDFGQPRLPWIMAQTGNFHPIGDDPINAGWSDIREQQRTLPDSIPQLSVVPSIDLPMDDGIHVAATGHALLGKRLARAACFQLKLARGVKDALRVKQVRQVEPRLKGWERWAPDIEVTFENVVGGLVADGVPAGFRLISPTGKLSRRIHKTQLLGNRVYLEAYVDNDPRMTGYKLAYGYEIDAYCNIRDEDGMAVPAFGPVAIEPLKAE